MKIDTSQSEIYILSQSSLQPSLLKTNEVLERMRERYKEGFRVTTCCSGSVLCREKCFSIKGFIKKQWN